MLSTAPPTFTHHDLPGNIHLAVNTNKKMKTVALKLSFVGNLTEDVATRLSLFPEVLGRGTRRNPDLQQINRFLEGLYGTSLSTTVHKLGERHLARFQMDVVNERFLPDGESVLQGAVEFLRELLVDPVEETGGFKREYLDGEKINLRRSIESLIDSKGAYAQRRIYENDPRNGSGRGDTYERPHLRGTIQRQDEGLNKLVCRETWAIHFVSPSGSTPAHGYRNKYRINMAA